MYPHERSLVKRLADKPFALVGVNSDKDMKELKPVLEKEQITWRSFQNDKGDGGMISNAWNVRGWPTLYVIDAKGVVRHKWVGAPAGEVMDKAIEKLVKEAEGEKK